MESVVVRYMRRRRDATYPKRYHDDSHGDYAIMYQQILQEAHDLHQPEPVQVLSRRTINRCHVDANAKMMQDYFNPGCRYRPERFKRRHGLPRDLFLKILPQICARDPDFLQRRDACNIPGHSPHMKMIAVMKHLAKGVAADSLDDYTQMAAATIYIYVKKFMDALLWEFNDRYMRKPTTEDTRRLLAHNEARGFPGMLGSLDCTHWEWRLCPTEEADRHVGHIKKPNLVPQAVESYDRWFWHCYFGEAGSNNDLNVLAQSGLFDIDNDAFAPTCNFRIMGHKYKHG
ncbi:uncharacterized protein LOC113312989 [Papaver somniferum]|uniref:uncharacterized protein LOC113312989 n=1 Tax=Papaver somniferum TaxID=3469 RepID=UPI000E6F8FAB|nr:uncharacterized protein LOC113312989 [Papaver somniferum]